MAAPFQQLTRAVGRLAPPSARGHPAGVPRAGGRGPARHRAAGVRLSAGARRRSVLARALASAGRCPGVRHRAAPDPEQRHSVVPAGARADPLGVRRRPRHPGAGPGQARDDPAARRAPSGDRHRPRLPDRALGLARAPDRALGRLAGAARRRAGAGPSGSGPDPRTVPQGDPVPGPDHLRRARPGARRRSAAGRAHARLRPGPGLAQGGAAAGLSADPAAGLCGPRLLPVGGRHGDRARSDHAADAGAAGAALVQRSRPRHAVPGGRRCLPAAGCGCPRDRPLARRRECARPARQALADRRGSGRQRQRGAARRLDWSRAAVRAVARQPAQPRGLVGCRALALSGPLAG